MEIELDSLLPDVKGRILEHLDHEDTIKLKSLSKSSNALIESAEFIQALSLKAKPVLTTCSFSIDKGVWQCAAFDTNSNSTSGHEGKWRKLPSLTFLPPNCDPDPDLFQQFLFCAKDGLVSMNFSKSTHEERIVVFNPLTQQWKELLPLLLRRNPVLMHTIQALSLKAKPVLTTCSFSIDKGVWQCAAFDTNSNSTSGHEGKWRKLPPLTFLPPNCDPDPDLFQQFLFCANEGLVCMNFSKSTHEERIVVFNPLTQQWKELPPLLHRRNPVLMHMYVDRSSKSYHILVAGSSASGEESLSRITELYDSRTGQWERVGDFPGPAFALNEYQSGVFQNGHIFCIGFLELGDQTVKGILGYNVEEGVWSTKWTDRGLPNSTILQLVENNGDLFLFSERDNGPLIEHWVDRIEWTPSEGDYEKTDTFTLVNVLKKIKSVGRSLEVHPEFALVPFSASQLCLYYTVDRTGEVYYIGDEEMCEALPTLREGFRVLVGIPHRNSLDHCRSNFLEFTVLHGTTRARMSPAPSLERFGCSTLRAVGFFTCLSVAGASPASAPGSSTPQMSSTYPTLWYWGVGATIVAAAIGAIGLGVSIYRYYLRRERGSDSIRGVLRVLTRPFGEGARGLRIFVGRLKVGEDSVDDLRLISSAGSSPV